MQAVYFTNCDIHYYYFAILTAQLVEHWPRNLAVVALNPDSVQRVFSSTVYSRRRIFIQVCMYSRIETLFQ